MLSLVGLGLPVLAGYGISELVRVKPSVVAARVETTPVDKLETAEVSLDKSSGSVLGVSAHALPGNVEDDLKNSSVVGVIGVGESALESSPPELLSDKQPFLEQAVVAAILDQPDLIVRDSPPSSIEITPVVEYGEGQQVIASGASGGGGGGNTSFNTSGGGGGGTGSAAAGQSGIGSGGVEGSGLAVASAGEEGDGAGFAPVDRGGSVTDGKSESGKSKTGFEPQVPFEPQPPLEPQSPSEPQAPDTPSEPDVDVEKDEFEPKVNLNDGIDTTLDDRKPTSEPEADSEDPDEPGVVLDDDNGSSSGLGGLNGPGSDDPPLPPSASGVRLYAWRSTPFDEITNALLLVQHETAAVALARARRQWVGVAPEDRCIMIAPWDVYQGPPFQQPIEELVKNGADLSQSREWWEKMLRTLSAYDFLPGRLALDWENGMSYWHVKGEGEPDQSHRFQPIWDDSEAFESLPDHLKEYEPDDFNYRKNRSLIIAWNQYAEDVRVQALKEAFVEPLLALEADTRVTNYRDVIYDGSLLDSNGWPYEQGGLTDESSPVLYRKNAEANLKEIRRIKEAGGPVPVPWVPYPAYIGREVWEQTVRGAYELGVREFLYWNPDFPDKLADDDAFAASVIADLQKMNQAKIFAVFD